LKFTFLGTGTSQGIPVIACECPVCLSSDEKDKRLRVSLLVESSSTTVCIDAGPDFRTQMLRTDVKCLDAVVFTHEHNDHTAGLDDVRAFNYAQKKAMPLYTSTRVQKRLEEQYSYIFKNASYPGVPKIEFCHINDAPFVIGDIRFTPIQLMHAELPVLGFRMELIDGTDSFTYITDANHIDEVELEKFRNTPHLVLNALKREKHHSHFSLQEAIALAKKQEAGQLYLTHISHQMGKHELVQAGLPSGMQLACDGLSVEVY
jgi:phosphoribosyl 1,2-cyclic phosphate phosphodiesterase